MREDGMTATIETGLVGGVRVLRLARPPVNAIDLGLVGELEAALADAEAAGGPLVLTGSATCFSAGVDTKAVGGYGAAERRAMVLGIDRMLARLYAFPAPAVAAVSGHALGGGLVLALACDVRIATATPAKIGLTEVTAGIPFPAGALAVVQAELSPPAARVLCLTGQTVDAGEGVALGLFDRVVPASNLLADAIDTARALAAAPAYPRVKAQLRASICARLTHIVEAEDDPLLDGWL
jgi:enoyl-CoA hydratase